LNGILSKLEFRGQAVFAVMCVRQQVYVCYCFEGNEDERMVSIIIITFNSVELLHSQSIACCALRLTGDLAKLYIL